MFSLGQPTRLTANVAGRYQISGAVFWTGGGGTFRNVGIRLNGTTYIALLTDTPVPTGGGQAISTLWDLNANDFVELVVEQNSGGTLQILRPPPPFTDSSPEFMMVKI